LFSQVPCRESLVSYEFPGYCQPENEIYIVKNNDAKLKSAYAVEIWYNKYIGVLV